MPDTKRMYSSVSMYMKIMNRQNNLWGMMSEEWLQGELSEWNDTKKKSLKGAFGA